jgi:hypothetical protein
VAAHHTPSSPPVHFAVEDVWVVTQLLSSGCTFTLLAAAAAAYILAVSNAEDPEKLLDQVVNEMQEDLIKMRQASAQVGAQQWVGVLQGWQATTGNQGFCS